MTIQSDYVSAARMMLDRVGMSPEAWAYTSARLKRAVVARALRTNDASMIDNGVRVADIAFGAVVRGTGAAIDGTGAGVGFMSSLLLLGGVAFGVAAHIWYQSRTLDEMSDAEYEAKVDNAEADWRRYGTRYATIAEVETGAYRSR